MLDDKNFMYNYNETTNDKYWDFQFTFVCEITNQSDFGQLINLDLQLLLPSNCRSQVCEVQ